MNNRKKWMIEPEFQVSFLKFTATILVVVSSIFYCAVMYFFYEFKQLGLEMGLTKEHVFYEFLNAQHSKMNLIVFFSFIVTSAVFMMWALFVSNKIAGPIYRLKKELNDHIDTGSKKEITFRKNDYFIELAELINKALKKEP